MQEHKNPDTAIDWSGIERLPEYNDLRVARRRVIIPVTAIYLIGYFGFLVLASMAPGALGHRLHGGLDVGFVLMGGVFVLVWVVALTYVQIANRRLDRHAAAVSAKAAAASLAVHDRGEAVG